MQSPRTLYLSVERGSLRLDKYLAQKCREISRSYIQKLIEEGYITVNGRVAKASLNLKVGDKILVNLPPPTPSTPLPENIPLTLVYEDEDIIVIDKPAGLTVHPSPGHPSHTLVNALLAHCPQLAALDDSARPGIVHRLDKDTSGLMVVVKNPLAQSSLVHQLKKRSMVKRYLVLVGGHLSPQQGRIEAPIGRSKRNWKRMVVTPEGREACTFYQVVRYFREYTLVEATLKTGRTHQIRVHLSTIGHPVIGDAVYGIKSPFLKRQFIHSHCLGFVLPSSDEYVEFHSELPPDLQQALERAERERMAQEECTTRSPILM